VPSGRAATNVEADQKLVLVAKDSVREESPKDQLPQVVKVAEASEVG